MRKIAKREIHEEIANDTFEIVHDLDEVISEIVSISTLYNGVLTDAQMATLSRLVEPSNELRNGEAEVAGRSGRLFFGLEENAPEEAFCAALRRQLH